MDDYIKVFVYDESDGMRKYMFKIKRDALAYLGRFSIESLNFYDVTLTEKVYNQLLIKLAVYEKYYGKVTAP